MSFGDTAIDEIRPTRELPGRSLLTGLIANALGLEHREVEALDRLQQRLRFAARLDQRGETLLDYQTALIGKKDPIWVTRGHYAERGGGTWEKEARTGRDVQTVQRYRHFRADSIVTIALALDPIESFPGLDAIAEALKRPERPLFIGRKSCPPSRPILHSACEASSLVAALAGVPVQRTTPMRDDGPPVIETEDAEGEPDGTSFSLADRRDWRMGFHAGLSRRRWVRAPEAGGAA